jgi:hypothetical protein
MHQAPHKPTDSCKLTNACGNPATAWLIHIMGRGSSGPMQESPCCLGCICNQYTLLYFRLWQVCDVRLGQLRPCHPACAQPDVCAGTEVALLWNVVGDLEVLVTPPGASRAYDTLQPELRIRWVGSLPHPGVLVIQGCCSSGFVVCCLKAEFPLQVAPSWSCPGWCC